MTDPLLAIDTSGARLQLALLAGDSVFDAVEARERGHAEILFDRIAMLLARANLSYDDLKRIAVITGPGSFSGLRIGLSAARGLGLALSIPVIGVPRLLALSLQAQAGPVGVSVDARRGEAYCEIFDRPGGVGDGTRVLPVDVVETMMATCAERVETGFADIAALARFAATADPEAFLPVPAYVREADAKPQQGARIARVEVAP